MRLREMYEAAFQAGIAADPRGEQGMARVLERARNDYEALAEDKSLGIRPRVLGQSLFRYPNPLR